MTAKFQRGITDPKAVSFVDDKGPPAPAFPRSLGPEAVAASVSEGDRDTSDGKGSPG